jgi:hypothetical protein
MLGHLVSTSRQSPPNFGITTLLRVTAGRLPHLYRRILSLLSESALHARKHPHPQ